VPLFDLPPKDSPRTLFGRDDELDTLARLLKHGRWTSILGPRMVGKTSLAKAALSKIARPGIYVNLWGVRGTAGLIRALADAVNANRTLLARLKGTLSRLQGVSVGALGLQLSPEALRVRTFGDLARVVGQEASDAVIVLDEVQELAEISGPLLRVLGNIFNTSPRVTFVFTGSYFGVMRTLLNPSSDSPLFGRSPESLRLDPFSPELAEEFLHQGFKENRIAFAEKDLRAAIDRSLDGIPGWLTLFGNKVAIRRMTPEAAERSTVTEGKKVARSELSHFLVTRPGAQYWAALRAMVDRATWTDVKAAIHRSRGAPVNDASVRNVLRSLQWANLISVDAHQYSIVDPMVRAFVRDSRGPP
jgi:AAA+ ATPase superfamily predicted ATPase